MKPRLNSLTQLRFLFSSRQNLFPLAFNSPPPNGPILQVWQQWTTFLHAAAAASATVPLSVETLVEKITVDKIGDCPKDSRDVLRRWGCSDSVINEIFQRRPSLRNVDVAKLQSKLNKLSGLGLASSDLVKIIKCRPHFLTAQFSQCFNERLEDFQSLFGSREVLLKAITRNPSLLTYDFHKQIRPVIATYEGVGVDRKDLIQMLLSRPTLISRTSLDDEKLDYIHKIGISKDSKMYKYVVTLIAISRIETIREKLSNFEKFGLSDDEVFGLLGRSPLVLTLSIDKVQRNLTFVLGMLKLPASVILHHPFLLFCNLEIMLKPRMLLARKIQDMGLGPQIKGPSLFTALRMKEKRFLKAFVKCHPKDIADELMVYYTKAKGVKRLAESSKKKVHKGFPF